MDLLKFTVVLIAVLFISESEGKDKCLNKPSPKMCARKPNEVYIDGGPPCQTICARLNAQCNIKAIVPVKACYCKNGYARNKFGMCVQINSKQCQDICYDYDKASPAKCARKPNEIYIDGGSPCQNTCATLNNPCNIRTFAPVKACYCKNGYARNQFGICVQINSPQCQEICKVNHKGPCGGRPNEVNVMGSACQATCQNLNKPCLILIADHVACRCKPGYARNSAGICIQINSPQCQSICQAFGGPSPASCARKANEVYINGGSACQTTCATLNKPCNIRPIAPVKACYCKDGYARNKFGVCVQINSQQCQDICQATHQGQCGGRPNEENVMGPPCQTTCQNLNKPCLLRSANRVACRCKPGYARNNVGICIQINSQQCQNICQASEGPSPGSCARKANEVYIDGGSPCQTTCATLNDPCNIQTFAPVKACYCKNGYARNKFGICVQINSQQCQNLCQAAHPSCARRPYEIYIQGGSPCQATCTALNTKCNIFTKAPVNGCYCINGYARDRKGNCIQINSKKCQDLCCSNRRSSQSNSSQKRSSRNSSS